MSLIFDRFPRSLYHLQKNVNERIVEVQGIDRRCQIPLLRFRKIVGKLRHESLGIPSGEGLFTLLFDALQGFIETIIITETLRHTFHDWIILLQLVNKSLTNVKQLVAQMTYFIGEYDACRYSLGRVWISGSYMTNSIVWRLELIDGIIIVLLSPDSCKGDISISDLEIAAHLLHFLILEYIVPLIFLSIAIFSDNILTVAWNTLLPSNHCQSRR